MTHERSTASHSEPRDELSAVGKAAALLVVFALSWALVALVTIGVVMLLALLRGGLS